MNKLSTENLDILPKPEELKILCKSISALEAIICPEWEYRYYSYQKDWSETEEFCEMRNGDGDHMHLLFSDEGVCINGFAKESKLNGWKRHSIKEKRSLAERLFGSKKGPKTELIQEIYKGIIDELPDVFHEFIFGQPVKSIGTTFCIWATDKRWNIGEIEFPNDNYKDGSSDLLQLLDGAAITYKKWAEEYYGRQFENRALKMSCVEKIYSGTPITKELVFEINPELEDVEKLKSDLYKIGYVNEL